MAPKTRAARRSPRNKSGLQEQKQSQEIARPKRSSNRLFRSEVLAEDEKPQDQATPKLENSKVTHDNSDSEEDEIFELDGIRYSTYQDMVDAKRKKNETFMAQEGLLTIMAPKIVKTTKRPKPKVPQQASRQSKRLKGVEAEGMYVEDERAGKFSIAQVSPDKDNDGKAASKVFYGDRINDGSDMTVADAVNTIGDKWFVDGSVAQAETFMQQIQSLKQLGKPTCASSTVDDSFSSASLSKQIGRLSPSGADPGIELVAEEVTVKVVPERIYSVATHPSTDRLLVCAGDKAGFVGIWNASSSSGNPASVELVGRGPGNMGLDESRHLFRFHKGAVTSMEWTPDGQSLLTTSYDSTCRLWNAETQTFQQIFASYDDDPSNAHHPGAGLDARNYYFQSSSLDHRNPSDAFFLSTSVGSVLHIDTRVPKRITWNIELSEKKINSVSLHPNGHSFLSSGLDKCVNLWDLRKFGKAKRPKAVATYRCPQSINSAYFSPVSGRNVVVTLRVSGIDVLRDFHLATPESTLTMKETQEEGQPVVVQKFKHDNQTGRWLSTFMAHWHPSVDDLFCVGSMERPRNVHVYNTEQQLAVLPGIPSVMSRCCFHPSAQEIVLVGGNSSGRVSVFRERRE